MGNKLTPKPDLNLKPMLEPKPQQIRKPKPKSQNEDISKGNAKAMARANPEYTPLKVDTDDIDVVSVVDGSVIVTLAVSMPRCVVTRRMLPQL